MRTETREVHWCDHCGKRYLLRSACEKHEAICSKNPENARACFGCVFLEMREVGVSYDQFDGSEMVEQRNALFCKMKEMHVYPPKVERSERGAYEFGDVLNKPMPRECDFREEPEHF